MLASCLTQERRDRGTFLSSMSDTDLGRERVDAAATQLTSSGVGTKRRVGEATLQALAKKRRSLLDEVATDEQPVRIASVGASLAAAKRRKDCLSPHGHGSRSASAFGHAFGAVAVQVQMDREMRAPT